MPTLLQYECYSEQTYRNYLMSESIRKLLLEHFRHIGTSFTQSLHQHILIDIEGILNRIHTLFRTFLGNPKSQVYIGAYG